jgi:uncharacterized protein
VRKSAVTSREIVLVDAGPLIAFLNREDKHHAWAAALLPHLEARAITCEAVVGEATHLLKNQARLVGALDVLLSRMEVLPVDDLGGVLTMMINFAPQMDFADACLVALARREPDALVLTTDTRNFSTYRVPFASPAGVFAE